MRTSTRLLVAAVALTWAVATLAAPVPEEDAAVEAPSLPEDKQELIKKLESDIMRATVARAAARAVRMEQQFEDDILRQALSKLRKDRGDPVATLRDVREIGDMLARDKRAVDLLGGLLAGGNGGGVTAGASVGASAGAGEASAGGGSDSGSILQLLPSLLGGSSGGDQDSEGGAGAGGGSDSGSILQLLPGLLGASSGGGDSEDGGGGGSNILGLISGLLGASSGGGDASGGAPGGGFLASIFAGSGGAGVAQVNPPAPGTYDDLIGKGISGYDPVYVLSNSVAGALRAKFSVFKTLVTNLVTSSLGGGGISFGLGGSGGGGGGATGAGASVGASVGPSGGGQVSLSAGAGLGGGYP